MFISGTTIVCNTAYAIGYKRAISTPLNNLFLTGLSQMQSSHRVASLLRQQHEESTVSTHRLVSLIRYISTT